MRFPSQIDSLILEQLRGGDKGLLRLVVALRKKLGGFQKGNLSEIVKAALHKLVMSKAVLEMDGIYSLAAK